MQTIMGSLRLANSFGGSRLIIQFEDRFFYKLHRALINFKELLVINKLIYCSMAETLQKPSVKSS